MNEDIIKQLNTPVLKSETSRADYADIDKNVDMSTQVQDINKGTTKTKNVTTEDNPQNATTIDTAKEIKLTLTKENTTKSATDSQWFYALKNDSNRSGYIYNIDNDGNLITELQVNAWGDVHSTENEYIDEKQKQQIQKAISNSKKQIDFLKQQEQLKEEIKGYPELNETALRLFEPDKTLIRFKNEKNQLRALLDPQVVCWKRILLSIVYLNKYDEFIEMKNKGVISVKDLSPFKSEDILIRLINDYTIQNKKLPSIQLAFNVIKLPYSEEFCKEYLLNEDELDYEIKKRYKTATENKIKAMSEMLKNYNGPIEDIIKLANALMDSSRPSILIDNFNDLQNYLENKEEEIKLSTGIKELDNKQFQLSKGKICSVFGYTGSFKTMFCTNVAYNNMLNGLNIVYLSLEISKMEMYINFLSRHSYGYDKKLSHSDIKAGRITKDDKDYLFNTIYQNFKDTLKRHLIVYDETDISSNTYHVFDKLLSQADKEFIKNTGTGVDMVIVDHLNLLKFGNNGKLQNDYSAVNHWMSYFRKNCIDFVGQKKQVAMLCACQSSREGYKDAKKHNGYNLTSIAEGNEIERSSTYVLSIYTTENDREENRTQMQILKLRDEAPSEDLIPILLEPKYYTFGIDKPTSKVNEDKKDKYSDVHNSAKNVNKFHRDGNYEQ